jgi:hypothetical protein
METTDMTVLSEVNAALGRKATPFKTFDELKAELPIQPGNLVKIKKGARVSTTHPKGSYECRRSYIFKVHDVYPGYDDSHYSGAVRTASVHWVGTGSYWFWTDMENVEKV